MYLLHWGTDAGLSSLLSLLGAACLTAASDSGSCPPAYFPFPAVPALFGVDNMVSFVACRIVLQESFCSAVSWPCW